MGQHRKSGPPQPAGDPGEQITIKKDTARKHHREFFPVEDGTLVDRHPAEGVQNAPGDGGMGDAPVQVGYHPRTNGRVSKTRSPSDWVKATG